MPHAATLYHPNLFAQLPALPEAFKQRLACGRRGSSAPVAALRAVAMGISVPAELHLLVLDFVHLYPDLNRVRLVLPEGMDGLRADEAERLIESCRPAFAAQNIELLHVQGRYGLLSLSPTHPAIRSSTPVCFTEPHLAQGMPLDEALPQGEAGRFWRQLASELQIELHHAPVNQQRMQEGRLSLNGVWIWSGASSTERISLQDQQPIWVNEDEVIEQIEARMCDKQALRLCSDQGCWLWRPQDIWKFWRRRHAKRPPFAMERI